MEEEDGSIKVHFWKLPSWLTLPSYLCSHSPEYHRKKASDNWHQVCVFVFNLSKVNTHQILVSPCHPAEGFRSQIRVIAHYSRQTAPPWLVMEGKSEDRSSFKPQKF